MFLPDLPAGTNVALDCETSGLYPDDGARVAVVSLAWLEGETDRECWTQRPGGTPHNVGMNVGCGYCRGQIQSRAYPFAQGKIGKPEDDGVRDLFAQDDAQDDPNLERADWVALLDWLHDKRLIFQNAKFDLGMMRYGTLGRYGQDGWDGIDLLDQTIWDTMLASKNIWPDQPTGLKPTHVRLFGEGDDEQKALQKHLGPKTDPRYDLVAWDIMEPYATADAVMTLRLAHYQWDLLAQGQGHAASIDRAHEVMRILYRMEWRGLPYDAAGSLDAAAWIETRARTLEQSLPFHPLDAKKYYYTRGVFADRTGRKVSGLGLEPLVHTDKGAVSFTADVVDRLAVEGAPHANTLRQLSKIRNASKMWYLPYAEGIGHDGRLRCGFRQIGTVSGRFSVERVNLQAIPHDYRLEGYDALAGITSPRGLIGNAAGQMDGWNLWEFDLAQAELRVAALWAGCDKMLSAITEGRDLHGETAAALFGVKKGDEKWGEYRQIGKRGNFTLCFGAGGRTFQQMVNKETGGNMSLREATNIVGAWNRLYPEFSAAIDRESRVADRTGRVVLANGQSRWFRGDEDTHKAFNQKVQGSLAELGIDWMRNTERAMLAADLDLRGEQAGIGRAGLLLTIHDSQVALLPTGSEGDELVAQIRAGGLAVWDEFFPEIPGGIDGKLWG